MQKWKLAGSNPSINESMNQCKHTFLGNEIFFLVLFFFRVIQSLIAVCSRVDSVTHPATTHDDQKDIDNTNKVL